MRWRSMETAPRDGTPILVRRHNDCFYEFFVVWWNDRGDGYPWRNDWTAYPHDRLDNWLPIPGVFLPIPGVFVHSDAIQQETQK